MALDLGTFGRIIDRWRRQRNNYLHTFRTVAGQAVLRDLARFCAANRTTFMDDKDEMLAMEGRRQVWLRIENHLNLSSQQLYHLLDGRPVDGLDPNSEPED
jgi:hypothetical protein